MRNLQILRRQLLYRGQEKIHSEIELIIYYLKWNSPTSIISLALLVLRPKLVLLLTDGLQSYLSSSLSASASSCLRETHLLYFRDTGSHVVLATVQQKFWKKFILSVGGKPIYCPHHPENWNRIACKLRLLITRHRKVLKNQQNPRYFETCCHPSIKTPDSSDFNLLIDKLRKKKEEATRNHQIHCTRQLLSLNLVLDS